MNDLVNGVATQAARSEWMAVKGLIVGRTKEMRIRSVQPDDSDGLIRRVGRYRVDICSVPGRVWLRDDVREQEVGLIAYERWKRRTHIRSGNALDLDYAIVSDLVHCSAMRPNDSALQLRPEDRGGPQSRG